MDNFIQITVFCPPEPRIGAFVYRNAGKVYWKSGGNMYKTENCGIRIVMKIFLFLFIYLRLCFLFSFAFVI